MTLIEKCSVPSKPGLALRKGARKSSLALHRAKVGQVPFHLQSCLFLVLWFLSKNVGLASQQEELEKGTEKELGSSFHSKLLDTVPGFLLSNEM